jgi:glutamyl-Q tRNA(Asp) synthetase
MPPPFLAVKTPQQYIGRFAPSPSGPLHFGSLVAALGSYLQAKKNDGLWLLRIEDIDPPREQAGASAAIMQTLQQHGLHWDGPLVYQSQQGHLYEQALSWLKEHELSYACRCTRKQSQACACSELNLPSTGCSIRFKNSQPAVCFKDQLLKNVAFEASQTQGDFVIKRKDGLYAYQLAVVVDDIYQGVTEVVRGSDLCQATAYQLALYQAFEHPAPRYLHLPVVVSQPGKKLSKQNHAPGLENSLATSNITHALGFLGLALPISLAKATVDQQLLWAIEEWHVKDLKAKTEAIDNRIGRPDRI